MKRILAYLMIVALGLASAEAQKLTGDSSTRTTVREAWHVYAFDDDVDAAFEVIADLDTFSYAALATADKIEALWTGAEDSSRVRIEGIKPDSTRKIYTLRTAGVTVKTTSDSLLFFERAWIDSSDDVATNALTIREASGNTTITTLIAGQHHSYVAHRFSAKRETNYINSWSVNVPTATGTIEAELRIYQDWNDVKDLADEYTVVDAALLAATIGATYQQTFDPPILIPQYGVAVIVGLGGAVNCDAKVKMSGYVTR